MFNGSILGFLLKLFASTKHVLQYKTLFRTSEKYNNIVGIQRDGVIGIF